MGNIQDNLLIVANMLRIELKSLFPDYDIVVTPKFCFSINNGYRLNGRKLYYDSWEHKKIDKAFKNVIDEYKKINEIITLL